MTIVELRRRVWQSDFEGYNFLHFEPGPSCLTPQQFAATSSNLFVTSFPFAPAYYRSPTKVQVRLRWLTGPLEGTEVEMLEHAFAGQANTQLFAPPSVSPLVKLEGVSSNGHLLKKNYWPFQPAGFNWRVYENPVSANPQWAALETQLPRFTSPLSFGLGGVVFLWWCLHSPLNQQSARISTATLAPYLSSQSRRRINRP